MKNFIVKGFVKYNGVVYQSGQVVPVKEADVDEFKKHGWLMTEQQATKVQEQQPEQEFVPVVDTEVVEETSSVIQVPDFDIMTQAQLQEELTRRGIHFSKSWGKGKLLETLRTNDEG